MKLSGAVSNSLDFVVDDKELGKVTNAKLLYQASIAYELRRLKLQKDAEKVADRTRCLCKNMDDKLKGYARFLERFQRYFL